MYIYPFLTSALDGEGWSTPRPGRFTPRKEPQAGLTGAENIAPTGIRSPHRPARSESLYRLRYPGPLSVSRTTMEVCRICGPLFFVSRQT
jgi:hypothetical protein